MSALIKTIARKFRIRQYKTTAFYPQSNESIKRSHHALVAYLKQFTGKQRVWNEWLDLAMFSYNTSTHEGIRFTPYELLFGKLGRTPGSDPPLDEDMDKTYLTYYVNLVSKVNRT